MFAAFSLLAAAGCEGGELARDFATMPIRIGIDLVFTDSIREALEAHGQRYLERVYTEREIADCSTAAALDPERLAGRFAAKEAALKALRVGDEAISWRDVEIERQPSGWVRLLLTGNAAKLARRAGITHFSLSLTHERGLAAAVVVAEIDEAADTKRHGSYDT